jgi:hypothetical protein
MDGLNGRVGRKSITFQGVFQSKFTGLAPGRAAPARFKLAWRHDACTKPSCIVRCSSVEPMSLVVVRRISRTSDMSK